MSEEDQLIERYFQNLLNASERKLFEERLLNDQTFREKVAIEKELIEVFNEDKWSFQKSNTKEVEELELVFKSDEVNNFKKTLQEGVINGKTLKNRKIRMFYSVSIAASIALLISVFWLLPNKEPNVNGVELFEYYTSQLELPTVINRGTENNKKLIEAETLFKAKNYTQALSVFNQILEEDKSNSSIYLHMALSNIYLENYEKAEETLNTLIKSDLIDAEKGYWVKSLMYLRQKNKKAAKKELEYIIKQNLYNKDKALELLEKIE